MKRTNSLFRKIIVKNHEFNVRDGTSDIWTLYEVLNREVYRKPCSGFKPEAGDVWLDAGAYIGEFAVWVMQNGAEACYSFEPHKESFNLVKLNTKGLSKVRVFNAAVGCKDERIKLYTAGGGDYKSNTTRKEFKSGSSESVKCIDIHKFLKKHKEINALKLDIEGAEMDIFDSLTDEELLRINKITAEWHFAHDNSLARYRKVVNRLMKIYPNYSAPLFKKLKGVHTYYPNLAALFFWK